MPKRKGVDLTINLMLVIIVVIIAAVTVTMILNGQIGFFTDFGMNQTTNTNLTPF